MNYIFMGVNNRCHEVIYDLVTDIPYKDMHIGMEVDN